MSMAQLNSPSQPSGRRRRTRRRRSKGRKSGNTSRWTTLPSWPGRACPLKTGPPPTCSQCRFRLPPKLPSLGHIRQEPQQPQLLPPSLLSRTTRCPQRLRRRSRLPNLCSLPRSLHRVPLPSAQSFPRQRAPTRLSPAPHRPHDTGCSLMEDRCSLETSSFSCRWGW